MRLPPPLSGVAMTEGMGMTEKNVWRLNLPEEVKPRGKTGFRLARPTERFDRSGRLAGMTERNCDIRCRGFVITYSLFLISATTFFNKTVS